MSKNTKRGIKNVDLGWDDLSVNLDDMFARSASPNGSVAGTISAPTAQGELPIDSIDHNPYQARQAFSPASLQELADSISEHGVIEPIIVRPVAPAGEGGERYDIVAGERRYRAALIAEQEMIPARIMELDARQAAIITALENLQREDLDIEDEARQFAYLCEALEVSQRELARMLGKNHVYIARRIRLLKRPDLMREYRDGLRGLIQAAALAGATEDEGSGNDGVSPRNSSPEGSGGAGEGEVDGEPEQGELELIEREDLPGYFVKRAGSSEPEQAGAGRSATRAGAGPGAARGRRQLFRWRPVTQFYNWVGRTHVADVPSDERATLKAQLTEIKDALEKQIAELEQLEGGSGDRVGTADQGGVDQPAVDQPAAEHRQLGAT